MIPSSPVIKCPQKCPYDLWRVLVQQILHEGQPAVDRYLKFLSSGSSDYSIELLKKAGVDMTSPEPVRQALQLFESHLSQMEQLMQEQ